MYVLYIQYLNHELYNLRKNIFLYEAATFTSAFTPISQNSIQLRQNNQSFLYAWSLNESCASYRYLLYAVIVRSSDVIVCFDPRRLMFLFL